MAPPSSSFAAKSASKSRIITLRLSKGLLARFPSDSAASAAPSSPSSSAVDSTAQATGAANTPDASAGAATSTNNLLAPPNPMKRKGIPGPKPGMKRNPSQLTIDGIPKPRGKPGPKKKMRVDGVNGTLVPVNAPKINPKASAGAINANLRALDRTGKPCRRWDRAPFTVKSFTGAIWVAQSWGSPKRPAAPADENRNTINGEAKSDSSATPSEIAIKQNQDGSAITSEKSNGDGDTPMPAIIDAGSSPAPVAA